MGDHRDGEGESCPDWEAYTAGWSDDDWARHYAEDVARTVPVDDLNALPVHPAWKVIGQEGCAEGARIYKATSGALHVGVGFVIYKDRGVTVAGGATLCFGDEAAARSFTAPYPMSLGMDAVEDGPAELFKEGGERLLEMIEGGVFGRARRDRNRDRSRRRDEKKRRRRRR